jgi:hypothetical protein
MLEANSLRPVQYKKRIQGLSSKFAGSWGAKTETSASSYGSTIESSMEEQANNSKSSSFWMEVSKKSHTNRSKSR